MSSHETIRMFLLSVLTLLAVFPALGQQRTRDESPSDRIDALLRSTYPATEPGAAVIVASGGKTLLAKAYGTGSLEYGIPLSPDTTFCLASVTKPITATGIMMLVEETKVDLDAPIARYLPAFPHGQRVKVKHLLSHTSGLADFMRNGSIAGAMHEEFTPDELIDLIDDQPLEFQPGERSAYSNTNYVLLARIVEVASGLPWDTFLRKRIFEPSGMTGTMYGGHRRIVPRRAFGYELQGGEWRHADDVSWTIGFGAGGLFSSVNDLARWNQALDAGKLVSAGILERMFTPFLLNGGERGSYGYGWGVGEMFGRRVVRHTGDISGYRTHIRKFPDEDVFIAILSNRWERQPDPATVADSIAGIVLKEMR